MIMLGNASNSSKSNFAQAYEQTSGKKDYISLVASQVPLDSRSDNDISEDKVFNSRHQTL